MPTCTPSPASTSVKASHDRATVASLWMTSDVRPPPPTAVRKFPVLNVWMVQVVGVASAAADEGWPSPTTPAAASVSPPGRAEHSSQVHASPPAVADLGS